MANKIIKHRLFTWFEKVDSPVHGEEVLTERIAHLGQEVDITNPAYVKRGEELGSFYSDDEAEAIKDGTYDGTDRDILFNARAGLGSPAPLVTAAEGEHGDVASMDAEQLAAYITENRLNIPATLALVPEDADEDTLNKFLDAENYATENEPRKGVVADLEARLSELNS